MKIKLQGNISLKVLDGDQIIHSYVGENLVLDSGLGYILERMLTGISTEHLEYGEIAFGDDGTPTTGDMTAVQGTELGVLDHPVFNVGSTQLNFQAINFDRFRLSGLFGQPLASPDSTGHYWNIICKGLGQNFQDPGPSAFIREAVLYVTDTTLNTRTAFARAAFPRLQIHPGNTFAFSWFISIGNSPPNWHVQYLSDGTYS